MVIRYTVPGQPVSTNHGYSGTQGGRLKLNTKGKSYKETLAWSAFAAWQKARRPEPLEQAAVALGLSFNTLGSDIDGPVKFILDSLQVAKLVVNDTRIRRLVLDKLDPDGKPRVEVAVGPFVQERCPHCGCACGGVRL
jgi:Holliday junction resolvase RusA-like endonuclease